MDAELPSEKFKYNRWVARRTAAIVMIVLYALLLLFLLRDTPAGWLETIIVVSTMVVALAYIIISRHSFTRLIVGPEGVSTPLGLLRTISWDNIEQVEYIRQREVYLPHRDFILFKFKPGVEKPAKLPLPRVVNEWLLRRGLRISLEELRAPAGHVTTAISRFAQIVEPDLHGGVETGQAKDPL